MFYEVIFCDQKVTGSDSLSEIMTSFLHTADEKCWRTIRDPTTFNMLI